MTPPQVWLTGAAGMLGRQVHRQLERLQLPFHASDREVDIRDLQALRRYAKARRIDWIINCAAYTAVDAAESDPDSAFALNTLGPENLARIAAEKDCPLLHISTDYVFDGTQKLPYREEDPPCPQSVYGRSKYAGEQAVASVLPDNHLILRISWLYGVYGKNFVETMLRIFREKGEARVVNDQIGAPSYAAALAEKIVEVILRRVPVRGLFHYADRGEISWYDFACAIAEEALERKLIHKSPRIEAIPTREFPSPAPRPASSRLDTARTQKELGMIPQPWRDGLRLYLEERRTLHATF